MSETRQAKSRDLACAYGAHQWIQANAIGDAYFKRCVGSCGGHYQCTESEWKALGTPPEPTGATQTAQNAPEVPEDTPDPDERINALLRWANEALRRAEAAEAEVERLTRECLDREATETDARERLRRCEERLIRIGEEWAYCPDCKVERTDYEGLGLHLETCPNCGATSEPEVTINGVIT